MGRHHTRVTNIRRHFLHEVSSALVKTHDRLVIEDLNVAGMMANHVSRELSAMQDGLSSPANFATSSRGRGALSRLLTGGIRQASSAPYAASATPS